MYCSYQDREELEDDLYQEGDGDSESEANSELEFHLYSQLHYSSNALETEEQVDRGEEVVGQDIQQPTVSEKSADVDRKQQHNGESRPRSLEISKLLQNLKKKEEKEEKKEKRGKRTHKDQRSSSSLFEEVIVIDSSPNVISISDDTADDDEGVCALKGQSLQQGQTSTPAQQGTQKRKRSLGKPVIVDLSSSESDSDSLSDSSESEDLENWMILGRGNQDGDQSISLNLEGEETISLNLEGGFDSHADVKEKRGSSWLVSAKDKEARIYNKDKGARVAVQRLSNRYYTDKSVQCRNCNKLGHLSKNCPEPKKLSPCFLCGTPGHLVSQCPNRHCSNCGQPGHLYESCSEKAYWHKQCHRCGMTGHFFDACPEIWRQYHITTKKESRKGIPVKKKGGDRGRTPAYCYNCSRKGHYGHACTRQRMFNGTYPTTPFINHYDTVEDIKRRQHRIGLKVQELQKNGIFLAGPLTPSTPGPPKKKQKINHKSNQTPHKSPNNHKPSPSHIFFSDKHDFMAPTPKTKKNKSKKLKQQESSSNVKPWKPKRPVPTSRKPPSKLILDEADDFPRGGGKAASLDIKKNKKKKKPKQAPSAAPKGHKGSKADRPSWAGEMHGSESKPDKAKRKRGYKNKRCAEKKAAAQTHPTDENLFNIKQRKRSR